MASDKKGVSLINKWKPKNDAEVLVSSNGKLFECHFERIFGGCEDYKKSKEYKCFFIKKSSYENQLDLITSYTNYFMNLYDPDNELAMAYLKIKYAIDKDHMFEDLEDGMPAYIDFIYAYMFTPTMVQKIKNLVNDNYIDDIENTDDDKKKYIKNDRKHLESLEFTNLHIKILLAISFSMKIMSPALFHYLSVHNVKIEKDSDIIYNFYKRLFPIFGVSKTFDLFDKENHLVEENIDPEIVENLVKEETLEKDYDMNGNPIYYNTSNGDVYKMTEVNMFNKLFVYVKTKVQESNSNNSIMFGQREIFGIDLYSVIRQFTTKVLISENVVKYKFPENYDEKQKKYKENIIGFNKTIIKYQLNFFLKDQYSKTLTEVSTVKNAEGLSGADKMAMNMSKVDESVVLLADINIKTTIDKIKRDNAITITEEEIQFYMDNHNPNEIQVNLVNSYYAKFFGSYRDLHLLTKRQYIELLLILKAKLLFDLGFDVDKEGNRYAATLPYLITGNLTDKVNTRIIRNNAFTAELEEDYLYNELRDSKYSDLIKFVKPEAIIQLISSFINTKFTYVSYQHQDLLGEYIEASKEKISSEILFMLKNNI